MREKLIRLTKKRSQKAGLPPGSLIHIGEKHEERAHVDLTTYNPEFFLTSRLEDPARLAAAEKGTVRWLDLKGLHEPELVRALGEGFGLHPLVLEDILNTDQRPKFEEHEGYLFFVLKTIDTSPRLTSQQVSLVLAPNAVLLFQEAADKAFDPVLTRITTARGRIRSLGPDYLAYALLDAIVDEYFDELEDLSERVEDLEQRIYADSSPHTLREIHQLKQEVLVIRKSIWPLREMIGALLRSETPLIDKATLIYYRDLYDHVIQVVETVEAFRELTYGLLEIHLSSASNRMNEVMKVLTIISTIFIPLSFLAGVYGMNFEYFPELKWPWAYFAFWGVNLAIAAVMIYFFRRKKWL